MQLSSNILAISTSLITISSQAIEIYDEKLRLGDIAILESYKNKIISELPENRKNIVLTEAERFQLLRKAYPGQQFRLKHKGDVLYQVKAHKIKNKTSPKNCYVTNTYIANGKQIRIEWVDKVECRQDTDVAAIGFDRQARVAVAKQSIFAGEYLGQLYLTEKQTIKQGDKLIFVSEDGPVIIQREVTALQGVQNGQNIFVKTKDGTILSSKFFIRKAGGNNEKKQPE